MWMILGLIFFGTDLELILGEKKLELILGEKIAKQALIPCELDCRKKKMSECIVLFLFIIKAEYLYK